MITSIFLSSKPKHWLRWGTLIGTTVLVLTFVSITLFTLAQTAYADPDADPAPTPWVCDGNLYGSSGIPVIVPYAGVW